MLTEVYRGQDCICSPGDVLFAVFQRNTDYHEPLPKEHAAIFSGYKPIPVKNPGDIVDVLEVYDHGRAKTWPTRKYEIHLASDKRNAGHLPLSAESRARIVDAATTIVRKTESLHDNYGHYKYCDWDMRQYKYVRPNPND